MHSKFITYMFVAVLTLFPFLAACIVEAAATNDLDYTVAFEGVGRELALRLHRLSISEELRSRPPSTPAALQRRVEEDRTRLLRAMRSFGYYSALVEAAVDFDHRPVRVRFLVEPGAEYRIQAVNVTYVGDSTPPETQPSSSDLALPLNDVFEAEMVVAAEKILVMWLKNKGHYNPTINGRNIRVEHSDHNVHVRFDVDPGPVGFFGETNISEPERLRPQFVQKLIPWQSGDLFSPARLNEMRSRLSATNLFGRIDIEPVAADADPRRVDVDITLSERPLRSVRLGSGYSTDLGFYLRLGWEHRNLTGAADSLGITSNLSKQLNQGEVEYRRPHFHRLNQSLVLALRGDQEELDAYDSNSGQISAMIEREMNTSWTLVGGVKLRYTQVENVQEEQTAWLFSPFIESEHDTTDDLLDPANGMRFRLCLTPTIRLDNADAAYLWSMVEWNGYLPVSETPRLTLAARLAAGAITGTSDSNVPADERFYSGGGNSVRGYDYQEIAPREDGEVVGGYSMFEASLELRWRMTEKTGLVGFLDGGNAFRENYPDFSGTLQWGAGLGFRYFTPIGPIRIDVAIPLNPAAEHNDNVKFYLSLGQAF